MWLGVVFMLVYYTLIVCFYSILLFYTLIICSCHVLSSYATSLCSYLGIL